MEIELKNVKKEVVAVALVSREDYKKVSAYSWIFSKSFNIE